MRKYLILASVAACLISSCGKNETPVPDDPSKESPGTNPGNGNPATQKLLYADPAFKAPTSFTSAHVFAQADGKILVDAYSKVDNLPIIKVHRLNADGTLDPSFDIDVDRSWMIKSIVGIFALGDGRVLLGGEFTINGQTVRIIRLSTTGAIDKSYVSPVTEDFTVQAFQRVANGKVIVTGKFKTNGIYGDIMPSIFRLQNDGNLDNSFVIQSQNTPKGNNAYNAVVPLTNGKLLVAGRFQVGTPTDKRDYIALINDDGTVDLSFHFKLVPSNSATISKIAVQSDGKIIFVGPFSSLNDPSVRDATYNFGAVARLTSNGALDLSFNNDLGQYGAIAEMSTLSDNRLLTVQTKPTSRQWDLVQDKIVINGTNGEIDNSYSFQYGKSIINSLFRLSPDNFLLAGQIDVGGVKYPVIKLKKN